MYLEEKREVQYVMGIKVQYVMGIKVKTLEAEIVLSICFTLLLFSTVIILHKEYHL